MLLRSFITYKQPYNIGDTVRIYGLPGFVAGVYSELTVDNVSVYHTRFVSLSGECTYIPNAVVRDSFLFPQ